MSTTSTVFVVDTSALVGKIQFAAPEIQLATTPLLIREMLQHGLKEVIQMLQDTKKMLVIEPTRKSLNTVTNVASTLGDILYLSKPDQQLLALALDLSHQAHHVVVLTDDYSIQNVAQHLNIEFRSTGQRGIQEVIHWETYCKACHRQFSDRARGEACPVCGTPLHRRAVKKRRIKNQDHNSEQDLRSPR